MASHKKQCCSTYLSPLSWNSGYQAIDPPICPAIMGLAIPIKIKLNGPSCDTLGDPNILPSFTLTDYFDYVVAKEYK